ncbi:DUF927 domain-containing protein [Clostridium perfringens]|uniref:DUF927 domain-containing protein n=1 Tax=Clostridium perfringens TaxID=1502 RepID=UPI00066550B0|nr:DUF927 domain-containing protein [Clostridium perfringens]MDK0727406.1 DUF927 domain-containing protein [Clostridium perfringens]MDK0828456.1 DUF927 domain-containing protein [Clostridium perfringens]MDM0745805.1 DUF927 domain-containing protein [Clostridium perfringens]
MIKHRPHEFKVGLTKASIKSIAFKENNTMEIYVRDDRFKGYAYFHIPLNREEILNKLLDTSSNKKEIDENADICTKIKQAKLEGTTINMRIVRNEHGRIELDDIIDDETFEEEMKRKFKDCRAVPIEIEEGECHKDEKIKKTIVNDYNGSEETNYTNFRVELKKVGDKFEVDENGVWEILENGQSSKVGEYMILKSIRKNTDTGEYKAVIRYKAFSEIKDIEVDREIYLNKNKIVDLINLGLDVTHSNAPKLVEYFRAFERTIKKITNVHSKIGFSKNNGEVCYKLYKCIGIDSEYIGNYEIEPKGTKEVYKKMLVEEVYGKYELEFIIISSLSAVILGYIGEDLGFDNIIIHLPGNSSTGKSTCLKLAISLFAKPDAKKQSLYNTYNATNNALLNKLGGIKGVPFALDEISMSSSNNFTKFIYAMANGTDKDRLNRFSELKEKETWLTTILSNGEKSLVDNSNKNAGIHVRVIEAANFSWTKDAENSEKINQTILKNYGHIGFEFAEYIMQIDKDDIEERVKKVKDEIYQKIDEKIVVDSMTKRRCNNYAVLLTTAYYYQEMMGIKLDIDGIINMLIEIEQSSISKRNFSQSAIDYIKQYISKFKRKFETSDNVPMDTLGKLIPKKDCIEVQMNKISFEEMIKQGGYEDKNVVLKELKQNGYLNCESDRFTRSRKNSLGYIEDVYVIKLPKEQLREEEEEFEQVTI